MSIDKSNDENIPAHTEDNYEALASQEQEYLDEGVEKPREREILAFEDSSPNKKPPTGESLDEQLDQATEELLTGDSDDPPLSEEAIVELLE